MKLFNALIFTLFFIFGLLACVFAVDCDTTSFQYVSDDGTNVTVSVQIDSNTYNQMLIGGSFPVYPFTLNPDDITADNGYVCGYAENYAYGIRSLAQQSQFIQQLNGEGQ